MENDKTGIGTIIIKDEFSSTEPVLFGTALMTLNEYEVVDSNTVVFTIENEKLKVEISSDDGDLKIVDELVPVKHLREGGPAYRIGIDFKKPIRKGTITVKYMPIL